MEQYPCLASPIEEDPTHIILRCTFRHHCHHGSSPPHDFLGLSEFSSGFLEDNRVDFAAEFDFGANFAAFDIDHDRSGSESSDSVSGLSFGL